MSMTEQEIDHCILQMSQLIGAELISICYDEKALQLRFEKSDSSFWFTISLKPGFPYIFLTSERIYLVKSLKKPLALFLKTHFFGEKLKDIFRVNDSGRVIELHFAEKSFLRATLFPGGQNIELHHDGKSLFSYKPKEQKLHQSKDDLGGEVRSAEFFAERWQQSQGLRTVKPQKNTFEDQLKKDIKKKQNGLTKMRDKLKSYEDSHWQKLGHWLTENQTTQGIPEEWSQSIDTGQSLSWNIENSFKQYKKNQSKIEGTLQRIGELEKEIEVLKTSKPKKPKVVAKSLMVHSAAKGRTFSFGEIKVYVGKSAKDNLTLLRKAKPWFLWLHIRDYPGAYGIIECPKKKGDLPLELMQKAAAAVVRQSVGDKAEGKYQVIIAECRYVKPIKGAKSGQVTYSHEKVITTKV